MKSPVRTMAGYAKCTLLSAGAMMLISLAPQAQAALVSTDWHAQGDSLITRDTSTGLEWLDLTASVNRSYTANLTQFGSGGTFSGFRYATANEVGQFFQNAGLPAGTSSSVQAGLDFVNLIGNTSSGGLSFGLPGSIRIMTRGIAFQDTFSFNPGTGAYQTTEARVSVDSFFGQGNSRADISQGAWPILANQSDVGSWLVRPAVVSAVPEPESGLMAIAGLTLLGAMSRKRKKPQA